MKAEVDIKPFLKAINEFRIAEQQPCGVQVVEGVGLVVGVTIWVWLGYKVCREKNAAPNGVIPDDSTT